MMAEDWKEASLGNRLRLLLPDRLSEFPEQGIDSSVTTWKGPGIIVRADYGLFSDPLTSYASRAKYKARSEEIDGHPAWIISFDQPDGSHVTAVHFREVTGMSFAKPSKLTVFVEASSEVGRDIPLRIIRSIHSEEA